MPDETSFVRRDVAADFVAFWLSGIVVISFRQQSIDDDYVLSAKLLRFSYFTHVFVTVRGPVFLAEVLANPTTIVILE